MPEANLRKVTWRARKLIDKQFIYGQLLHFGNEGTIYANPQEYYRVDITTKGESIGIVDKNGKELYEGDLILATNDHNEYGIYVIVYRGCKFVGKQYNTEDYIDLLEHDLEIVGIYYNSELEQELQEVKSKIALLIQNNNNNNRDGKK